MRLYLRLFALVCFLAPVIYAQSANVRVQVVDPNGAFVPACVVELHNAQGKPVKNATTNQKGEAALNVAAGAYQLAVTGPGFEPYLETVSLTPGANQVQVRLAIAAVTADVAVDRDKREAKTDPRGDAFTNVLTSDQIAQLPDDPEEFEQAVRNMAGPGARFRVNGFGGGRLPPKDQIREIRFRMNPYAAENHDASFIGVDIYTKPGLDRWRGSANFGFRDEALNARPVFAPFRAPEQNRRFGLEFGGPLVAKKTSLFVNADGVRNYEARPIFAARADGLFNSLVRQPRRSLNLSARVEHALNPIHTLRAEFQRNANRQENLGVGNFDLAERGYTLASNENLFRLAESGTVNKKFFNEIRLQTRWQQNEINSLSDATTINVLNAFTSGGAQLASNRRQFDLELADNLDFARERHAMRAGFELEAARYNSREQTNANGTFVFASLDDFRAGRPTTYTRRAGAPAIRFNQIQFGWYWQDDWRLRKNFSLSFGLRHEIQNNVADRNNFAPRLGFTWSPFKDGKTTLRGGFGIFYDWFPATAYETARRVNGTQQSDLVIRNPGFPDPFSGGAALVLPPSRVQVADDLRQPYVAQASAMLERELPRGLRLMAMYFNVRGVHNLRGRNINAPLGPGLPRPDPTLGNVTRIESTATSRTQFFNLNLNWMNLKRGIFFGSAYSLAQSTDDADGPLSLPADNFNLRGERGPAAGDIRHRFFLNANFTLPYRLRLGLLATGNSAAPYNITTGFDNNGDTVSNDRPAGGRRNAGRGTAQVDLSARLSWGFGFGKLKTNGPGGPQVRIIRGDDDPGSILGSAPGLPRGNQTRYRLEFYTQATNLLNHANLTNFVGVQTSPFFGRASAARPGRRIETGMRFSF